MSRRRETNHLGCEPAPGDEQPVSSTAHPDESTVTADTTGNRITTTTKRLSWVDASRGLAIYLVVLLHLVIGHLWLLNGLGSETAASVDKTNQILSLLRLPLLFTISGYLAASKISTGLSRRTVVSIASNSYLYLIWLGIFGLWTWGITLVFPDFHAPHRVDHAWQWLIQVAAPQTYLWYLLAIVVNTVIFAILRRINLWVMLPILLGTHVWMLGTWTVESPLWTRMFTYTLYFAIGIYGRKLLWRATTHPLFTLVSGLVAYGFFRVVTLKSLKDTTVMEPERAVPYLILSLSILIFAVGCVATMNNTFISRALGHLGRHSLGIYVLHVPLITVYNLVTVAHRDTLGSWLNGEPMLAHLYAGLVTAVIIGASVGIERVVSRGWFKWLFVIPEWVKAAR